MDMQTLHTDILTFATIASSLCCKSDAGHNYKSHVHLSDKTITLRITNEVGSCFSSQIHCDSEEQAALVFLTINAMLSGFI